MNRCKYNSIYKFPSEYYMAKSSLKLDKIALPNSFRDLPKSSENLYRYYFVDGTAIQIEKDKNESTYNYRFRSSFVLARLFNNGVRIGELIVNSRIGVNKRWAAIIKDEDTGAYVQSPYYPDTIEDQYRRIKALVAYEVTTD